MKRKILALALCMVLVAVPVISTAATDGDNGIAPCRFIFEDGIECD